jgi:hypothetical protein
MDKEDNSNTTPETETEQLMDKFDEETRLLDERVNKFYSLKDDYESRKEKQKENIKNKMKGETNKKIRNTLAKQQFTCVNCLRKVNMYFSVKNGKLIAKCGSETSPCNLKIIINRGTYYPYEKIINGTPDTEGLLNEIENFKVSIIRMKLDMIFDFENVRDTLKGFNNMKDELEELYSIFKERNAVYLDTSDKYDLTDLKKMELKRDEIISSLKRILSNYETKTDVEKQELKKEQIFSKLADIYVNDLNDIIKQITNFKYNVYNVEYNKKDNTHNFVNREYTYVDTIQQEDNFSIESFIHSGSEQNKIE